jgi:hypothetical protein
MDNALPSLQAEAQYSETINCKEINEGRLQDQVDLSHCGALPSLKITCNSKWQRFILPPASLKWFIWVAESRLN